METERGASGGGGWTAASLTRRRRPGKTGKLQVSQLTSVGKPLVHFAPWEIALVGRKLLSGKSLVELFSGKLL